MGTTLKGGGGGTPINGVETFNKKSKSLFTDENNSTWLESGNTISDIVTYPDAEQLSLGSPTLIINYDKRTDEATPNGVALDENYIYVVGSTADKCWIYDKNTLASIDNFLVNETTLDDVSVDDNYIYVLGSSKVKIFNKTTPFALVDTFNTDADKIGVAVTDEYMYIAENDSPNVVEIRNKTTPFALVDTFNGNVTNGFSIDIEGDYIYMVTSDDYINCYRLDNPETSYIDRYLTSGDGESALRGVAVYETKLFIVGLSIDQLLKYDKQHGIGMITAKTDTDTGLPIYTRIK